MIQLQIMHTFRKPTNTLSTWFNIFRPRNSELEAIFTVCSSNFGKVPTLWQWQLLTNQGMPFCDSILHAAAFILQDLTIVSTNPAGLSWCHFTPVFRRTSWISVFFTTKRKSWVTKGWHCKRTTTWREIPENKQIFYINNILPIRGKLLTLL